MTMRSGLALLALALLVAPRALAAQDQDGLEKKAAAWIGYLQAEQYDSAAARVSPVAEASMGREQLAMIWPQIVARFGALEETAPLDRVEQGGYVLVQLLGTFARGEHTIRIAFDKDGLVAGFFVLDPPGASPAERPRGP
jgi:hypothetical protein